MDNPEDTDEASIKPVSSLRSHFENMIKSKPPQSHPSPALTPSRGTVGSGHGQVDSVSRGASLDIPRSSPVHISSPNNTLINAGGSSGVPSRSGTPRLRPVSIGTMSPSRSPPLVTVDSPRSPPMKQDASPSRNVSVRPSREDFRKPAGSRNNSPTSSAAQAYRLSSRSATPAIDGRQTPLFPVAPSPNTTADPQKVSASDRESPVQGSSALSSAPPPINRAAKPRIFSKPSQGHARQPSETLMPNVRDSREDERISPFSTPPSEHESPPDDISPSPPPIPESSKPRLPPSRPARDGYFAPPPFHYAEQEPKQSSAGSEPRGNWIRSMKLPTRAVPSRDRDSPEDRPHLPPRREEPPSQPRNKSPRPPPPPPPSEPPMRRSMDTFSTASTARPSLEVPSRVSMDSLATNRTLVAETNSRFQPPPRRTQAFGISNNQTPRPSGDFRRPEVVSRGDRISESVEESEDEEADYSTTSGAALSDYPDSSQANRRPPRFREKPYDIATKYETKLLAVCGEFICTSGYITRVWSLLTGELLFHLQHGETVKVTALAFKPAKNVEEEGQRIWLGTNGGELLEIDIPSQSIIVTKSNAHTRMLITKIHRQASEMWTLDDEGKMLVWPTGEDGLPSLGLSPHMSRVPKGATFSIIVGNQLWIAYGKEIWIFQHSPTNRTATQMIQKPLMQSGVGEVTAGTVISSQPDRIYFGHVDGKVAIYSRKDFSCLGVVNVSLYKISSLVGVGDYLWAGFNTGMIYVYDTTSHPWKVKKDWKAHENTIASILVDRTSIWKLDRLQVASLGTDGLIRIWDGMLRDDWLELDMQEHDVEFCDFREETALVMTWNAGASKPSHLKHDDQDSNFFRELLRSSIDPPTIVVFGFQELVDLEDKKITARTLFKSSKKKDHVDHERMSRQYRDWKDHLTKCLDDYMPASQPYTLLHTANLVGLFTCVFVKTSEMLRIREVDAAEVKLGMKGRYGNKGALIVRFMLDDSSICFVNCHLAAGQRQTVHRNNDVAGIMEASALKPSRDSESRSDMFVSGGDGSMILDHEICILNGDLNYRIDTMSRDIVIREVNAGNLAKLLDRDQLLLSRKKNPGFRLRAFQEKEITFAPTYKYDVGSNQYDSSEKKRSPAWCDRLLYRGVGRIKQIEYRRHEVRVSDHRPVSGLFKLRVKTINAKRRMAMRDQCEQRFEDLKQRIAMDIKLDYLVNVFGLSNKEADRLLKQ